MPFKSIEIPWKTICSAPILHVPKFVALALHSPPPWGICEVPDALGGTGGTMRVPPELDAVNVMSNLTNTVMRTGGSPTLGPPPPETKDEPNMELNAIGMLKPLVFQSPKS